MDDFSRCARRQGINVALNRLGAGPRLFLLTQRRMLHFGLRAALLLCSGRTAVICYVTTHLGCP
jgi:hypothetical protein